MKDIKDFHDVKSRFTESTIEFWELNHRKVMEDDSYNILNPFKELHKLPDNVLDSEPMVFASEADWIAYINHAAYEKDKYRPGVCIGILVDENLSKEDVPQEDKRIRIEIFAEAKRGSTPS